MSYTPTAEQAGIYDHFRANRDNLVIEAGAGTGKTSTLKGMSRIFPRARGIYIAYNRSIADEAAREFPRSVTCKTAHGLAFGSVGRQYAHRLRSPRMPAREVARILGIREPVRLADDLAPLSPQQLARLVMETVSRYCYSADQLPEDRHVPKSAGLDDPATHAALCKVIAPLARKAWVEDLTRVDGLLKFSHDMYLKIWQLTGPQLPADYVLLDEAQDSNPAVADIVTSQNAVKILVGDRCQAIYGWRGATDAMSTFDGVRFRLSQSFRFGERVAVEANKFLGLLDAPLRLSGYDEIPSTVGGIDAPDAILCRSNAGAVLQVMEETGRGRRAALVGGGLDIRRMAEAAVSLREGRGTDHPDLFAFSSWQDVQEYVQMDSAGADLKVFVDMIDKYTPEVVIATCERLVDEDQADVSVSTAHRSKGREWARVQIGSDFREPKPDPFGRVRLSRDELMLGYVAVTRARVRLDRGSLEWVDEYASAPPVPRADPWAPAPEAVRLHNPAAIMPDELAGLGYAPPAPGTGYRFPAATPEPEPVQLAPDGTRLADDCLRCETPWQECRCKLGAVRWYAAFGKVAPDALAASRG